MIPSLKKWYLTQPSAFYTRYAFAKHTTDQRAKHLEARKQTGHVPKQKTQVAAITTLTQRVQKLANKLEVAQAVNQHQTQSIEATISGKRKKRDYE
jgi:hypothetical protein